MNELERYLDWIAARLDQGGMSLEEPDLEIKSDYKQEASEGDAVWELADLLAAMSNDVRIDGYRALVYGPQEDLSRPSWLSDESRLRDKLLKHFDAAVIPGVELVRRTLPGSGQFDAFVVIERDSTPYVTRLGVGGQWGVRVRSKHRATYCDSGRTVGLGWWYENQRRPCPTY